MNIKKMLAYTGITALIGGGSIYLHGKHKEVDPLQYADTIRRIEQVLGHPIEKTAYFYDIINCANLEQLGAASFESLEDKTAIKVGDRFIVTPEHSTLHVALTPTDEDEVSTDTFCIEEGDIVTIKTISTGSARVTYTPLFKRPGLPTGPVTTVLPLTEILRYARIK